jgi:hypothetical protein
MYVRVTLDIKDKSYEEANFIRETFIDKYQFEGTTTDTRTDRRRTATTGGDTEV